MAVGDTSTSPFLFFIAEHYRPRATPPYGLDEVAHFLITRGYLMGAGFACSPGYTLFGSEALGARFELRGNPAYLSVEMGKASGERHAVYWDGWHVFDPDPTRTITPSPLANYDVVEVWPITRFEREPP